MRALFIDAKSGRLRTIRDWPTASKWSWIARAPGGKFVVITPERLTLYSPAIETLKHLDLAISQEGIKDAWRVAPSSPGAKYLLVEYELRRDENNSEGWSGAELRRELVDTETLHIIRAWTEKGMSAGSMTISDDGIATTDDRIGTPDGPFHPLCTPSHVQPYCGGSLVSTQVIFSLRPPGTGLGGMGLLNTNGDLLFQQDFLHGEVYRAIAVSANGQRLAISLDKGKGGSAALDIAPRYSVSRVIVYDLSARRWVYSLEGKKQGLKSISGLALSPDGSQLGLINQDGILEVYSLPDAPSSPKAAGGSGGS